jgi:hypothetical protein
MLGLRSCRPRRRECDRHGTGEQQENDRQPAALGARRQPRVAKERHERPGQTSPGGQRADGEPSEAEGDRRQEHQGTPEPGEAGDAERVPLPGLRVLAPTGPDAARVVALEPEPPDQADQSRKQLAATMPAASRKAPALRAMSRISAVARVFSTPRAANPPLTSSDTGRP